MPCRKNFLILIADGEDNWACGGNGNRLDTMRTKHIYSLDGEMTLTNVWWDRDGNKQKSADEWRTVIVGGLRQGGEELLCNGCN